MPGEGSDSCEVCGWQATVAPQVPAETLGADDGDAVPNAGSQVAVDEAEDRGDGLGGPLGEPAGVGVGLGAFGGAGACELGLDCEKAAGAGGDVVDVAGAGAWDVVEDQPAAALETSEVTRGDEFAAGTESPAAGLVEVP
jgi:hypothetical protein